MTRARGASHVGEQTHRCDGPVASHDMDLTKFDSANRATAAVRNDAIGSVAPDEAGAFLAAPPPPQGHRSERVQSAKYVG